MQEPITIIKLVINLITTKLTSNYNFPILFVKRKPTSKKSKDLKFRMVVDYRLLNSITESFKIFLPQITDILQNTSGKNFTVS